MKNQKNKTDSHNMEKGEAIGIGVGFPVLLAFLWGLLAIKLLSAAAAGFGFLGSLLATWGLIMLFGKIPLIRIGLMAAALILPFVIGWILIIPS